jgi:hypothetical protein
MRAAALRLAGGLGGPSSVTVEHHDRKDDSTPTDRATLPACHVTPTGPPSVSESEPPTRSFSSESESSDRDSALRVGRGISPFKSGPSPPVGGCGPQARHNARGAAPDRVTIPARARGPARGLGPFRAPGVGPGLRVSARPGGNYPPRTVAGPPAPGRALTGRVVLSA